MDKIIKRDGRIVPFNREKITMAILSAAIAVGGRDRKTAEMVTDDVINRLKSREKPFAPLCPITAWIFQKAS